METKKIRPRGRYTEAKIAEIKERNEVFNARWGLAMSKIPTHLQKSIAPLVQTGLCLLGKKAVCASTISRTKSRHIHDFTVLEGLERFAKIFEK